MVRRVTREDFMREAEREINDCFSRQRNRLMNIVQRAWAEGKRNAEIDGVTRIVRDALNKLDLTEHDPAVDGSLEDWTRGEEERFPVKDAQGWDADTSNPIA